MSRPPPVREPQSISSSSNQLEAMIRAYPGEVFNHHDLSQLDRYMSVDLISTWFGDRTLRGLPAWRDAMAGFFAAFPDAAFILDDILLRRRQAAWRGTRRATQARRMRRHRSHQP